MIFDVKWATLDTSDGSRSIKQHAFVAKKRRLAITLEEFVGNKSLCGKITVSNEDENPEEFSKIIGEPMKEDCCQICKGVLESKNNALYKKTT